MADKKSKPQETIYRPNKDIRIVVDSCADLNKDLVQALGVDVIEFEYVIDGEAHADDFFASMSAHEFYNKMRKGLMPSTTAVTVGQYYDFFERAAKDGKPTLYLGLTEGLSSSITFAEDAAQKIKEAYPDFELYVIDNKCPSAAAQLLAMETVHQANMGMPAHELAEWVKEARYFVHGYFTLESFEWLAKGGRMPAAAASIGSKLDIKPELSYDTGGALTLRKICRGKKKAFKAMLDDFREKRADVRSMPMGVMTSDAEGEGDVLEALIRREPGCEEIPIIRSSISTVVGSHVGPGMVAMVFWGSDRREKKSLTSKITSLIGQ